MPDAATEGHHRTFAEALLRTITGVCARHPVVTLVIATGLCIASIGYTWARLEFKTSRADLIDPDAEYQQRWLAYTEAFGDASDMVVTVEAQDPHAIAEVLETLGSQIEREQTLFKNALYKVDPATLRAKGLQYLGPRELQLILDRVEEFRPILRGQWSLFTLRNIFEKLRQQLDRGQKEPPEIAAAMSESLLLQITQQSDSLTTFLGPTHEFVSPWEGLFPIDLTQLQQLAEVRYTLNEKGTMGFLKVQSAQPDNNFSGISPATTRLRELISAAERRFPHARLGLTGIPVLESDEMRSSQTDMTKASVWSFLGVAILMVWGFRGLRHPIVSMLMLTIGMCWSFGFLTFAIGHLNILSVSFATMLLGLGIDFAIVYLSQYVELRHHGRSLREGLLESSASVGPGIVTAAFTCATAFFVAVFVDFAGVRELGIITGGGVLLCLVAAFTVLPALLALSDRYLEPKNLPNPFQGKSVQWLTSRYPAWVTVVCTVGISALGVYGLRVIYDYNLLNLQAEGLPSVKAQERIFELSDYPLLSAVSLADSPREALELKRKFEKLPTVHHVEDWVLRMLPPHPAEETNLLVQSLHEQTRALPTDVPPPRDINPETIGEQLDKLHASVAGLASPAARSAEKSLDKLLDLLHGLGDGPNPDEGLQKQITALGAYQWQMAADALTKFHLIAATSAPEPVTLADLPQPLARRYISPDGKKWLLPIYPKQEIWDAEPLKKFIKDVRSIDSDATGTPIQNFEATHQIKRSYELAGLYALAAVCLILLIDFRSGRDTLLALIPVAMGGLFMFGTLGWLDIDLNPANLIVLPLIVGLGVDGGVHMVHDFRTQRGRYKASSSTLNALVLNGTTTIVGFAAMIVAAHRGLYSLGLVVTIGISCCYFVALIMLPAVLTLVSRSQQPAPDRHRRLVAAPAPETTFPHPPHSHRASSIGYHPRSSAAE